MNNIEVLKMLKDIHGEKVMCTNGLFSMLDADHNEVYIDKITGEVDARAVYRTLVVLDNVVVARVIGNERVNFVVLNKENLNTVYTTTGIMYYIDNNVVCDFDDKNETCKLISHNGTVLANFEGTRSIKKIWHEYYTTQSVRMYSDLAFYYNKHRDSITLLNEEQRYSIVIVNDERGIVDVTPMGGITYNFNFDTREAQNKFTGKKIQKQIFKA